MDIKYYYNCNSKVVEAINMDNVKRIYVDYYNCNSKKVSTLYFDEISIHSIYKETMEKKINEIINSEEKILEIYKNTKFFIKNQDNKVWEKKRDLLELTDKTVTIVGCGNVGIEVAKRLKAFGCKINGVARRQVKYDYIDKVYNMEELNEALKISDIVVLTIALNEDTKYLFNKEKFDVMKDEAVLVNVARGAIVKEEDLIEVLKCGKFMGVALDVMENEPLCVSSELWDFDRVLVTPHNSFVSDKTGSRMFGVMCENLEKFIRG